MTRSRIKWRVNSREPNSNLQKYTHWRVDKKKKKKPVFKKPKPWVVLVIHVTSWNRYENDDETVTGTPVCQCQRVDMCYCFSVNFFALILKEKYLWDPQNIAHSFMLLRRWLVIIYNKHMTHESEFDWYSIKMCTSLLCLNQLEYIFAPSVFFLSCFKDCLFLVCSFHPRLQKVCKSLLNFYSVAKNNLRSRKRNEQLSKYTHGKRFDTQTRIWLVAG